MFNSVNNNRELIKGMSNEVLDLQFAHMKSIILLGCIEQTALHVHKIEDTPEKVLCTLMVKIEDPIVGHVPLYDKIKWCPFVPEGEDEVDEYVGQQLVWFRGNVYQCYSIKSVVDAYGVCLKTNWMLLMVLNCMCNVTGWKTTKQHKCNRRKLEAKRNFCDNRSDFFARWYNIKR